MKKNKNKTKEIKNGGLVIKSKLNKDGDVEAYYLQGGYHMLVIGTTGSGKSQEVIIPSILSIANCGGSMIVNDVKGELYSLTSEYLKRKGYTVYLMDYFNPMAGTCFNQLYTCRKKYETGLPHFYAIKAIKTLLKIIDTIQDASKTSNHLQYFQLSTFEKTLPAELAYLKEDPTRFQKNNSELKVLHLKNFEMPKNEALEEISKYSVKDLVGFIHELIAYIYEAIQEDDQEQDRTGLDASCYNNKELRIRQEKTCQAIVDILSVSNIDNVKKYYQTKIERNNEIIARSSKNTSNYNMCIAANKEYDQILNDIEENFSIDILLDFYKDLLADHEVIWEDCETQAVDSAGTIAKMLIGDSGGGDKFWTITAEALIKSLILLVCRESFMDYSAHLGSVGRILSALSQMDSNEKTGIDIIFDHFSDGDQIKLSQAAMRVASEKTKSSILASAIAPLSIFNNSSIVDQASRLDFEPEDLIKDKVAVFLCTPGADDTGLSQYTILSSLFIEQFYSALNTAINTIPNQKSPRPIFYLLDEICNAPAIPGLGAKVALARSKNIWFTIVVQAYEQLKTVYKTESETIKENSNILYLLSNNTGTAKEISDRIGKATIEINSISNSVSKSNDSSSSSESTSLTGRELMTAQELMKLKAEEGILLLQRQDPYKTSLAPAYKFGLYPWLDRNKINNIHVRRNPQEVNYFCPDPNKFSVAYELTYNSCLLDKYIYNILSSMTIR